MYKNWMNGVQDGSESCTSLEEYKKDSDIRIRTSLSFYIQCLKQTLRVY